MATRLVSADSRESLAKAVQAINDQLLDGEAVMFVSHAVGTFSSASMSATTVPGGIPGFSYFATPVYTVIAVVVS